MFTIRHAALAAAISTLVLLAGCDNAGYPLPDFDGDGKLAVNVGGEVIGTKSPPPAPTGVVRAGVAVVDDTWQVGACAGQYCDTTTDPQNLLTGGDVDPFFYHRAKDKSYGVQSRLSARAIVVEGSNGRRIALVKTDNYLAQDMLIRRAAQILETHRTSGVHYDDILYHVTHDHSAYYYATLSWGVWLFQDVYDQRAFEFQARKIAEAIEKAAANLKPARMGATVVRHTIYKGNVVRLATATDGTPAGYPLEYNDHGLTLIRFDDISNPSAPKPMAIWANWGEHPESLDGYGLHSADYLGPLERFVQRDTGATLVWSQGDVGSSENTGNSSQVLDDQGKVCGTWFGGQAAPQSFTCPTGQGVIRDWDHKGYVETERNVRFLADSIKDGFAKIGANDPSIVVPYTTSFPVDAVNAWVMGPLSHPYPSVSNCVTDTTTAGDPGVPVLGLPDCARFSDYLPGEILEPLLPVFGAISQIAGLAQQNGIPIPDNYDFSAFTAVEENLRLKLQAFRLGDIVLASCACEAQNDLILNLKSRLNSKRGDIYDGFDWACLMPAHSNEPVCQQQLAYYNPAEFPTGIPGNNFSDAAIAHMRAEVHNDARGWDLPQNILSAMSEPTDNSKIFGNFTKEEIQDLGVPGYKLAVGIGHGGDYNGYTVSFREYENRDSYRKALTSYGPHTADYMVTRLVRMAAQMQGGPAFNNGVLSNTEVIADEQRQRATALLLGQITNDAYNFWLNAVPNDGDTPHIVVQPQSIEHFNGATFSWVGGSTAIDNPIARVEREYAPGKWQPFADGSGEVQTMVQFPNGAQGVVTTWTGGEPWHWTANFEAYAAHPTRLGSTPPGNYRFVVDGKSRQSMADVPYHFVSNPFTVTNWGGLGVQNAVVDTLGNVSFDFAPVVYPRSYSSPFKFIQDNGDPRICDQCTFRPWAKKGVAKSAVVTVKRANGTLQTFAASLSNGHWKAATKLLSGDQAFIAPGGLRDNNNETNRAQIALR
ncbi:MAG TPA: neutral/alkaline non-lysosomal ceramidase N-terminal domain-containing protein [Nevskiaceae bacterium]|nr:neutral/alkaline non-lysosomal ceramidase N-terminal domain-containing protein [Nevskiaceae bacterium]